MPTDVIAYAPVLNAGRNDIDPFDFTYGARVRLEPDGDLDIRRSVYREFEDDSVSARERVHLDTARAWIWYRASLPAVTTQDHIENVARAAGIVRTLLWCADLAGCGENDYWRSAGLHAHGVYVYCLQLRDIRVQRSQFLYNIPIEPERTAGWTEERLRLADSLREALAAYQGTVIPRLAIAHELRYRLAAFDASTWNARFMLAGTALETFYVAPSERQYFWEVAPRVQQVCGINVTIGATFFDDYRNLRNDITHRGGVYNNPIQNGDLWRTISTTERILRATVRWGIQNQQLIADHFDRDSWPPA